jgi:hypothetical protein
MTGGRLDPLRSAPLVVVALLVGTAPPRPASPAARPLTLGRGSLGTRGSFAKLVVGVGGEENGNGNGGPHGWLRQVATCTAPRAGGPPVFQVGPNYLHQTVLQDHGRSTELVHLFPSRENSLSIDLL